MQPISIKDFNYVLPEEKIARYPLNDRAASKLLHFNKTSHQIRTEQFRHISKLLPKKSLLIFNNTKVIPARLHFTKDTGAAIEIFCLEPASPDAYEASMQSRQSCTWHCMIGNAKKWKDETLTLTIHTPPTPITLQARKTGKDKAGKQMIRFQWNKELPFIEVLQSAGKIPIPPYLKRKSESIDTIRYQTIYSKTEGSVAAPTAGLHFTPEILQNLQEAGIETAEITLHVGAGTFLPVKADNALEHPMHTEHFTVSRDTLMKIQKNEHIIAVGTTSARTLESLYWLAQKNEPHTLEQFPWHLNSNMESTQAISQLLNNMGDSDLFEGSTRIMIAPGYSFRLCKGLITNFHQPQSTLLLLIAAFVGDTWKQLYQYALDNDYRFLSYGDSSLLLAD